MEKLESIFELEKAYLEGLAQLTDINVVIEKMAFKNIKRTIVSQYRLRGKEARQHIPTLNAINLGAKKQAEPVKKKVAPAEQVTSNLPTTKPVTSEEAPALVAKVTKEDVMELYASKAELRKEADKLGITYASSIKAPTLAQKIADKSNSDASSSNTK